MDKISNSLPSVKEKHQESSEIKIQTLHSKNEILSDTKSVKKVKNMIKTSLTPSSKRSVKKDVFEKAVTPNKDLNQFDTPQSSKISGKDTHIKQTGNTPDFLKQDAPTTYVPKYDKQLGDILRSSLSQTSLKKMHKDETLLKEKIISTPTLQSSKGDVKGSPKVEISLHGCATLTKSSNNIGPKIAKSKTSRLSENNSPFIKNSRSKLQASASASNISESAKANPKFPANKKVRLSHQITSLKPPIAQMTPENSPRAQKHIKHSSNNKNKKNDSCNRIVGDVKTNILINDQSSKVKTKNSLSIDNRSICKETDITDVRMNHSVKVFDNKHYTECKSKEFLPHPYYVKSDVGYNKENFSVEVNIELGPGENDYLQVGTGLNKYRSSDELSLHAESENSGKIHPLCSESSNKSLSSAVTVAVRARPLMNREQSDDQIDCVIKMNGTETSVVGNGGNVFCFPFDHCLWSFDSKSPNFCDQHRLYTLVAAPLLKHALEGYNVCLFAYGQTGSGKSYSMMGPDEEPGIIPQFCQELFQNVDKMGEEKIECIIEISYFEIYNEKIYDLLVAQEEDGKKPVLKVREHPIQGPYVVGLSSFAVRSYSDLKEWILLGNKRRATAATGMNDQSSRSHSIFTLSISQTKINAVGKEEEEFRTKSLVNLVDLAGSERVATAHTSGERLKEGVSINKSLMTLGKVISQLAEKSSHSKGFFISYRESVLTWLLRESLGGNSRTAVIATISPCNIHLEETLSTLRYASQARQIVNIARINEDPKICLIRELRSEIDKLRKSQSNTHQSKYIEEIEYLKSQLQETKSLLDQTRKSWKEKFEDAVKTKEKEKQQLQKVGIIIKDEAITPSLVQLSDDPLLSETLCYLLQPGLTTIGRLEAGSSAGIQLSGKLIAGEHCIVKNEAQKITVIPKPPAEVFVNGNLVTSDTVLHHGDRIVLGGEKYFRTLEEISFGYHSPLYKLHTTKSNILLKGLFHPSKVLVRIPNEDTLSYQKNDFQFSVQELQKQQESRLKKEITAKREHTCKEMLEHLQNLKQDVEFEANSFNASVENQRDNSLLMPRSYDFLEEIAALFPDAHSAIEQLTTKLQNMNPEDYGETDSMNNCYTIMLWIKEANQLANELGADMVCSRCDLFTDNGLEQVIRVRKSDLGIVTYWSLQEFEKRLQKLRNIVQGSSSSQKRGDLDDELFSTKDVWEKDNGNHLSFHSNTLWKNISAYQRSMNYNLSSSSINTSTLVASPTNSIHSTGTWASLSTNGSELVAALCRILIAESVDELGRDWSMSRPQVIDQVLLSLRNIMDHLRSLQSSSKISDKTAVLLLLDFDRLKERLHQWLSHGKEFFSTLERIVIKIQDDLNRLGKSVFFIFQGIEKNVTGLVEQWASKALEVILNLSTTVGHLGAFLGHVPTWCKFEDVQITKRVVEGAISGVFQAVDDATELIDEGRIHVTHLLEDSFYGSSQKSQHIALVSQHAIASVSSWVKKISEFQILSCPPEIAFQKCICLFSAINKVTECIQQLSKAAYDVIQGSEQTSCLEAVAETLDSIIHSVDIPVPTSLKNAIDNIKKVSHLAFKRSVTSITDRSLCNQQTCTNEVTKPLTLNDRPALSNLIEDVIDI